MEPKLPPGQFYGNIVKSREVAGFRLAEGIATPGAQLPKHLHEGAYFTVVLQGACTERYGNQTRECHASTLTFHPPGEVHSVYFPSATRLFNVAVEPGLLDRLREHTRILESRSELRGGPPALLAQRLYCEFRRVDACSLLAMEGLVLEILAEASRCSVNPSEHRPPRWLEQVREILHSQFFECPTLAGLAEAVGVHPVHLARAFRKWYHCSVGDYVRRLRIEFACREISASDVPLVEIASEAGFADQAHFSRTFKRCMGLTPTEFRDVVRSR
jgi:AraC family transcriptional regulator